MSGIKNGFPKTSTNDGMDPFDHVESMKKYSHFFLPAIFLLFLLIAASLSITSVERLGYLGEDMKYNSQSQGHLLEIPPKDKIDIDLSFLPHEIKKIQFYVICKSEAKCPDLAVIQGNSLMRPYKREPARIFWILDRRPIFISNPSDQKVFLNYFHVTNNIFINTKIPRYLLLLYWPGWNLPPLIFLVLIVLAAMAFQVPCLIFFHKTAKNIWCLWEFWVLAALPVLFTLSCIWFFLKGCYLGVSWETFLLLAFLGPLFLVISWSYKKLGIDLSITASGRFKFIIFSLLILVIFLDRFKTMKDILFSYADEDTALWWYGATEYAKGMFHEPRVFGQPYLTFIDSFFAVPLLWFWVPVDKALPVISSLFALAPFGVMSYLACRTGKFILGGLILIIPLTLPIEFNIISSLHGRETAYFVLSIALLLFFIMRGKAGYFFFGLLSVIPVSVSMDSVLIVLPLALYAIYKKGKELLFIKWGTLGLLLGFMIHILTQSFYRFHPDYVLHGSPESVFFTNPGIGFSLALFLKGICNLDMFWKYLVPVFHYQVWFLLLLFIFLLVVMYKQRLYYLIAVSLIAATIFLYPLGMGKAYDGSESVYFSFARNWLGIPFFIGLMILWISQSVTSTNNGQGKRWWYVLLVVFVLLTWISKYSDYDAHLKKIFNTPGGLPGEDISYIEKVSQVIEKAARNHEAGLVIFPDGNRTLNYGCAAKLNGKVETLLAGYERRTWRIEEESNQLRGNFLIYGFDEHAAKEWEKKTGKKAKQINQSPNLVLVESAPTLVLPFLHEINMPMRANRLAFFYYRRGLLLERSANFPEAIADYSKAIKQKPDFDKAYYHRGMVNLVYGEYRKAIDDFSSALEFNPADINALFYRAMAYEKNGNHQEALSDLHQVKKRTPKNSAIINYFWNLSRQKERHD